MADPEADLLRPQDLLVSDPTMLPPREARRTRRVRTILLHESGVPSTHQYPAYVCHISAGGGIRALLTEVRISMTRGASQALLTPRQWQVLTHVAHGSTNQDIAEALVISVGTVKRHLHDAYATLQVSTRLEAVRACGLLTPPPHHSRVTRPRVSVGREMRTTEEMRGVVHR
ncbi:response regulator transcription factor [Microbacterium sp. NPDC055988]|uniref:response regulator transcription factor n=1 Tax=Microbacterium sp. NPDC055988 TaxID=3345671 RepID=UPI0035D901EA